MKVDKAIEILELIHYTPPSVASQDFKDAIFLSTQGLKRITANRKDGFPRIWTPLPGETRDESWRGH